MSKIKITRKRPILKDLLIEYAVEFIILITLAIFGINIPLALYLRTIYGGNVCGISLILVVIELLGLIILYGLFLIVGEYIYKKYHETKAILDFAKIPLTEEERKILNLTDALTYLRYIQNTVRYKKFLSSEYTIADIFYEYRNVLVKLYKDNKDIQDLAKNIMNKLGPIEETIIVRLITENWLDKYELILKEESVLKEEFIKGNESKKKKR